MKPLGGPFKGLSMLGHGFLTWDCLKKGYPQFGGDDSESHFPSQWLSESYTDILPPNGQ